MDDEILAIQQVNLIHMKLNIYIIHLIIFRLGEIGGKEQLQI